MKVRRVGGCGGEGGEQGTGNVIGDFSGIGEGDGYRGGLRMAAGFGKG
jgi:hypothetical protein